MDELYGFGEFGGDAGAAAIVMLIYFVYFLIMLGIGIAQYVLQSVGMYTISKRRGIRHPWLSWLPVGCAWILGCISDQYQYVVKGKVKRKRKSLLVLTLLPGILSIGGVAFYIVSVIRLMMENGMQAPEAVEMMSAILSFLGIMLVVLGISIALAIINYIALYDLFASCEPKNSALYLVLSIFVGITMPLLVFLCRKKDLGMPSRRSDSVQPQEPLEIPNIQE
jgi:hypothetical protein